MCRGRKCKNTTNILLRYFSPEKLSKKGVCLNKLEDKDFLHKLEIHGVPFNICKIWKNQVDTSPLKIHFFVLKISFQLFTLFVLVTENKVWNKNYLQLISCTKGSQNVFVKSIRTLKSAYDSSISYCCKCASTLETIGLQTWSRKRVFIAVKRIL